MKALNKILLALLIIISTCVVVDIIFGTIADAVYLRKNVTKFQSIMDGRENADIVFIGSSRASHHYDTPFLNDSLGIKAINLGQDGRGLTYHEAVLLSYLDSHTPKTVVLEVLPEDLNGNLNKRIKALYPFVDEYKGIRGVAERIDPLNRYLLKSNLYRYNSEFLQLAKNLSQAYDKSSWGYEPLEPQKMVGLKEDTIINTDNSIDGIAKTSLLNIINATKDRGIKLIVTVSPEYNRRNTKLAFESICDSAQVPFINNGSYRFPSDQAEYFNDNYHLNKKGARLYTRSFIDSLIQNHQIPLPHNP